MLYTLYLASQRLNKTRSLESLVKDKVLLGLFLRLKLSHFPISLAITCCNRVSPGKLRSPGFMLDSRSQRVFLEFLVVFN